MGYFLKDLRTKEFKKDKTMLNINAHKNPSTLKPGTILSTKSTNSALITKVNKPKVKRLIGSVKITRTGFKKALIMPITRAVTKAAVKLST